jgi:hypothetical protein
MDNIIDTTINQLCTYSFSIWSDYYPFLRDALDYGQHNLTSFDVGHSLTEDYLAGRHPLSVKLRTVHHYSEFCVALQKWLQEISDNRVKSYMIDEYFSCLSYVYMTFRELTFKQFVSGVSFSEAAVEYYGRVKRVYLWQYEKGENHKTYHRPTGRIKAHPSYKSFLSTGDETHLIALKAAFERLEQLRCFVHDNRWLLMPIADGIIQKTLTDYNLGLWDGPLSSMNFEDDCTVLNSVQSFLSCGSQASFAEFVCQLQAKLKAKVKDISSLVTTLDSYSLGNNSVSATKTKREPTVSDCQKSQQGSKLGVAKSSSIKPKRASAASDIAGKTPENCKCDDLLDCFEFPDSAGYLLQLENVVAPEESASDFMSRHGDYLCELSDSWDDLDSDCSSRTDFAWMFDW